MGNSVRKLSHCCSCDGGSLEMTMTSHVMPHPSEDFVGHSFCYVRPDPTPLSSSENHSSSSYSSTTTTTTTFHSISGASVSANLTTVPLAAASSTLPDNRSSTFKSSELVAGLTLQPVPRGNPHCWSGPMDPGFLSGPIINFNKTLSNGGFKSKKKGWLFTKSFKRTISDKMLKFFASDKQCSSALETKTNNNDPSSRGTWSVDDDDDGDGYRFSMKSQNLQWAQGKAGEDRTHLVVSGEEGWIFVGIYDGFSGPDAPDHLLSNLFDAVLEELKRLLWNDDKAESDEDMGLGSFEGKQICGKSSERFEHSMNSPMETFQHSGVLKALSEGLNKTEETYLKMANLKPELHAMGSCVLVMLMNGEDVYLMNVGDSRAILALKTGSSNLIPLQLTMDHNVDVEEEVERIRQEHPDDDEAVVNERVKGYLKVTRAFGAGFLKQYFTNQQVVSEIECFIASFPDGDPAQHLVEQVLIRAAEKAGLEFHELVEIPSGERRMYHDDVSVIIISLEGRIWRSFSK
ncbi:hypothetical protein Goshw_027535 [Gossypium schwendimanii]|uniref:PPM-type phosphatase domain-containing protein n=1 Tax=Gossypium schwendimanii TaxID=34291 RepID=A0A7J9LIY6_GOSSC|nr:hypothetical protein [Gossypium schwendimanii]